MPMKYTVVRTSNVDLMVTLNEEQEDYGIDQVQIGEEIGETYQQQAPDRTLVRTHGMWALFFQPSRKTYSRAILG